ncbi:MAG: molybdopterin cofactor-binding domain-containing protein, partial [Candidatus Acidiferrum sp.]
MSSSSVKFVPEPERYEFTAGPMHHFELARRDFFKFLGAGIAVFAVAKDSLARQETAPTRGFHQEDLPENITAWLHIGEDGNVTAFTGKVEVGQNVRTALAQTVADELRVPFDSVTMVMADTALTPFDFGTVGSRSMPTMSPQLRRVASAARDLLVDAAAKEWNVSAEGLTAANGKVTDPASGRSLKYGELARGKTLAQNLPAEDPVTPPDQWAIAGKPIPKKHARSFVTGEHQYTPDLRRPGMLYGKVLRPPSFAATLTSYDAKATQTMNGVVIVHDGDFIGAAAATEREAQKAVAAIRTEWKEVPQTSSKELFSYLKQNAKPGDNDRTRRIKGSMEEGLAAATHRLDATYTAA